MGFFGVGWKKNMAFQNVAFRRKMAFQNVAFRRTGELNSECGIFE